MNEYKTLLELLLAQEDGELTINSEVTAPAIRKGLKSAVDAYNMEVGILGGEPYDGDFTITTANKDGIVYYTIKTKDKDAVTSKGKFSFSIVEDNDDGNEERT